MIMKRLRWLMFSAIAMFCFRHSTALSAFWVRSVISPAGTLISRFTNIFRFPLAEVLAAIVIGMLLMCLITLKFRQFVNILLVMLWMYTAMWYPVYFSARAEVEHADDEALYASCAALIEELNDKGRVDCYAESMLYTAPEVMDADIPVKATRYSEVFDACSLAGFYSPFTNEAIVNADAPACALGFTACHELAHSKGIADEALANAEAFEHCVSYGGAFEYSAKLWALKYTVEELNDEKPLIALNREILADLMRLGVDTQHCNDTGAMDIVLNLIGIRAPARNYAYLASYAAICE